VKPKAVEASAVAPNAPEGHLPPPLLVAEEQSEQGPVPEDPQVAEAFKLIDGNGNGSLTRIEVIKACRKDEQVRKLLGLPEKLDDGARDKLEGVFQGMDEDHDKMVDMGEFQRWMARLKAEGRFEYQSSKKATGADGEQLALPAAQ